MNTLKIRPLLISILCVSFFLISFSSSGHAASIQQAKQSYMLYIDSVRNSANLNMLDQFLSQDLLKSRAQYVTKMQGKTGKSQQQAHSMLMERVRYSESCIYNRKFMQAKDITSNSLKLVFSFEDICAPQTAPAGSDLSAPIVATIEEIEMVNENGWKINHVYARPSQPQKIRKVIRLE